MSDWFIKLALVGTATLVLSACGGSGSSQDHTAPTVSFSDGVSDTQQGSKAVIRFNASEAASLSFAGGCSSQMTAVVAGDNQITLDPLPVGRYSQCTLTLRDHAGNVSLPLLIPAFNVVDNAAPVLTEAAESSAATDSGIVIYRFISSEAGRVFLSGACTTEAVTVVAGENQIMLGAGDGGRYDDCALTVLDTSGNHSTLAIPPFSVKDTQAPVLAQLKDIAAISDQAQPVLHFHSSEAGQIAWSGACSSEAAKAVAGDNQISLTPLSAGRYESCAMTVTDSNGNTSTPLMIGPFDVFDATKPELSELAAIGRRVDASVVNYEFYSSEAGAVSVAGGCASSATSAQRGNNVIALNVGVGSYSACTVTVTDAAGNVSDPLDISDFSIVSNAQLLNGVTFVDGDNTSAGDGSRNNPYQSLSDAISQVGASGEIYVMPATAPYTGQFTLPYGVKMYGAGANFISASGGYIAASQYPVIDGASNGPAITLLGDNRLQGLEIRSSGNASGVTSVQYVINGIISNYDTTRVGLLANGTGLGTIEFIDNRFNDVQTAITMLLSDSDLTLRDNTLQTGSPTAAWQDAMLLRFYGSDPVSLNLSNNTIANQCQQACRVLDLQLDESVVVTLNSSNNHFEADAGNNDTNVDVLDVSFRDNSAQLTWVSNSDVFRATAGRGADAINVSMRGTSQLDLTLNNADVQQTSTVDGAPVGLGVYLMDSNRANIRVQNSSIVGVGNNRETDAVLFYLEGTAHLDAQIQNTRLESRVNSAVATARGGQAIDLYAGSDATAVVSVNGGQLISDGNPNNINPTSYIEVVKSSQSGDGSRVDWSFDGVTFSNTAGQGLDFYLENRGKVNLDVTASTFNTSLQALRFVAEDADPTEASMIISNSRLTSSSTAALELSGKNTNHCFAISGNTISAAADGITLAGTLSVADLANLSNVNNGVSVDQAGATVSSVAQCPLL